LNWLRRHAFATPSLFCHSEPSEESLLFLLISISEIPRSARNDNFALAIVVIAAALLVRGALRKKKYHGCGSRPTS
jgi:hypothetical protein